MKYNTKKFFLIAVCCMSGGLMASDDAPTREYRDQITHELPLLLKNHDKEDVIQRMSVYLQSGGNPNLADHFNTSVLHMLAHYGNEEGVKMLVESDGNDAMVIDTLGFTARDYARVALITRKHNCKALEILLKDYETMAFDRRKSEKAQFKGFMEAFYSESTMANLSTQLIKSGRVAKVSSGIDLGILADFIPIPGASAMIAAVSFIKDFITDKREQAELERYVGQAPDQDEIHSEAKKLAYALAFRYADPISRLSADGAKELGEYCAKKVEAFCKEDEGYAKEVKERTKSQSFVHQALAYLRGLPKEGGFFATEVKLRDGKATYKAKDVLNGLHGLCDARPVVRVDPQESARVKLLLKDIHLIASQQPAVAMTQPTQSEQGPRAPVINIGNVEGGTVGGNLENDVESSGKRNTEWGLSVGTVRKGAQVSGSVRNKVVF